MGDAILRRVLSNTKAGDLGDGTYGIAMVSRRVDGLVDGYINTIVGVLLDDDPTSIAGDTVDLGQRLGDERDAIGVRVQVEKANAPTNLEFLLEFSTEFTLELGRLLLMWRNSPPLTFGMLRSCATETTTRYMSMVSG